MKKDNSASNISSIKNSGRLSLYQIFRIVEQEKKG